MPDDATAPEVVAPNPAQAAEPARAADPPRAPTLEDAFRAEPEALKGREPTHSRADAERASEESAAPDAASKPDAATERGQDGPSRRGAAAKISEQASDIDRLLAERDAERARTAEIESRIAAQESQKAEAQKAALARIGDDRVFAELSNKRMRGEVMSYEDDERLTSMLSAREWAADLWEMTDRAHKALVAAGVADRVEKHGLDKGVAYDAPLPELIDHVAATTEARVRKETANEIAELKAQLRGLRTRGAAAASPTVGGASAPGGAAMPPDGASPLAFFEAALRSDGGRAPKQEAVRNGRR
jgi:hypothetical protein